MVGCVWLMVLIWPKIEVEEPDLPDVPMPEIPKHLTISMVTRSG